MDGVNCIVLLSFLLVIQVEGLPLEKPPSPDRNKFDIEEIIALETKPVVEGRKDEKEFPDAFAAILAANERFNESIVARKGKVELFEGDIISNIDTDEIKKNPTDMRQESCNEKNHGSRKKRATIRDRRRLWTKRGSKHVIPYVITSSNAHASRQINAAMREWMNKVPCLQFVSRTNQGSYLSFFSGGGCYSMVGMQGGRQAISIGRGCEHHGVIVHEIGHALGLWHEQSRPDRDTYVRINWGAIQRGMEHNFKKYTTSQINSYNQPYDVKSVMHYGELAFSRDRRTPTITRRDGKRGLGQRNGLSEGDVTQARLMYCGGTGPQPTEKPGPTSCVEDKNANCRGWAQAGYCTNSKYKEYMTINCCKSCKAPEPTQPPPPCVNKHIKCDRWALDGLCKLARNFMEKDCCHSCKNPPTTAPPTNAPEPCEDKQNKSLCEDWENQGFCTGGNWKNYMKENCPKTCKFCS